MIMVTGGAYQGKTPYVMRRFGIGEKEIADGEYCSPDELKSSRCIKNFHKLVKRLGDDCISFTEELCRVNRDVIIIIDEIGCGIVPMEKGERIWRENVGRCGCIIASASDQVIRIVCGIPSVIKGEE